MITKDVKAHLADKFADYLEPVSELSKSDGEKVLVRDERKLYNFDKITEKLYPTYTPESADAVFATDREVFFVEFKSGFHKKISKENFDKKYMSCYDNPEKYCEGYAKLFLKNQRNEDKILRHSLHMKAIEGYMTFMQEIVPESDEDKKQGDKYLTYCVVVDDYVEHMEDILNDLAKKTSETNLIEDLRKSLSRFRKSKAKDYYYDYIEVLSPCGFVDFMNHRQLKKEGVF